MFQYHSSVDVDLHVNEGVRSGYLLESLCGPFT